MFKLVIVSVLVAVAVAKPGAVIKREAQVDAQPGQASGHEQPAASAPSLSGAKSGSQSGPSFGLASAEAAKPIEGLRNGVAGGISAPVSSSVKSDSLVPSENAAAINAGDAPAAAARPARGALLASPYIAAIPQAQPLLYAAAPAYERPISTYGHSIYQAAPTYFAPTYAYI